MLSTPVAERSAPKSNGRPGTVGLKVPGTSGSSGANSDVAFGWAR